MDEIEYEYRTVITVRNEDGSIADIHEMPFGSHFGTLGFISAIISPRLSYAGPGAIEITISASPTETGNE